MPDLDDILMILDRIEKENRIEMSKSKAVMNAKIALEYIILHGYENAFQLYLSNWGKLSDEELEEKRKLDNMIEEEK